MVKDGGSALCSNKECNTIFHYCSFSGDYSFNPPLGCKCQKSQPSPKHTNKIRKIKYTQGGNIIKVCKVCDCCGKKLSFDVTAYICNNCSRLYDLCELCKLTQAENNCPSGFGCVGGCAACGKELPLTRSSFICMTCGHVYTVCPLCRDKSKDKCPQDYGCNTGT